MKINYHLHSGVSVEFKNSICIFDYYKRGLEPSSLAGFENVYVFASHAHGDHFDKTILGWKKHNSNIRYIFSYDIEGYEDAAVMIKPGCTVEVGGIRVTAFESTDEGVAFLIDTPEGSVFHAGDLGWWHWEGEPDEWNKSIETGYKKEIDKLAGRAVDIAFIPVDKRLEDSMYYSIDYLMAFADVGTVCPIHFWNDWDYIEKVKKDLADREYYKKIYFYGR